MEKGNKKCTAEQFNWDDLRYFSALADAGTVSAAANRLGVNYVTVSRRIDRLENAMQVELFARTKDGYILTLEGDSLYQHIPSIHEIFEKINESMGNIETSTRTIRISTVESLATTILAPNLSNLKERLPNLTIEIDVSSRNVNIAKRESDIAIRLRLPDTGEYLSRKLSFVDYILCATEELKDKVESGVRVPIISFAQDLISLPESEYIYKRYGLDSVTFRSNSATVQSKAAQNGIGIALLPKYLLKDTNLVRIEPDPVLRREIWLLTKQHSTQLAGIRMVIDSIYNTFEDNLSLLIDE